MERIVQFSQVLLSPELRVTGDEVKEMLQTRFFFDLVGLPFSDQIYGLLRLVDSSRLLYGSDYPYTPVPAVLAFAKKMDDGLTSDFLSEAKENVYLKNAQEFLARPPRH
jgi:predicted TIM-barrel fold metal-dependent hydrolase